MTAACATLPTVTDVDPSTGAQGAVPAPVLTADDLARLTGGRLLARSDHPIRGAAVDSRLVEPGELFVALPGENVDGHAFVADAIARGATAVIVTRPVADPTGLGDVTVVRVADARGGARRGGGRLAAPVQPARRRGDREHRQDLDQGGHRGGPRRAVSGRCATRATRTTRWACR